jgi:GT2 family glycosyltransferase
MVANSVKADGGQAAERSRPLVVSIVVNYRGLDETATCLTSLLAIEYPAHELVLVDNDSGNGDAAALEDRFGNRLHVIASTTNLGYGGAANLGLRWAIDRGAVYAWVLNNDTVADPGCVAALVDAMEAEPSYGATSPVIDAPIGPESPNGIWYAGGRADPARASASHLFEPLDAAQPVVPTGFVTGCAMFLRCSALDRVGLFWPELFLYWEDVDLSLRLRDAGWNLGVVPAAHLRHMIHGSVSSRIVSYYSYRNALLVARRHGRARGATRAAAALSVRAGRRWLACTLKGQRPFPTAETRGFIAGLAAILRGSGRSLASGSGSGSGNDNVA